MCLFMCNVIICLCVFFSRPWAWDRHLGSIIQLPIWHWVSYLISLRPSFLICMIVTLKSKSKNCCGVYKRNKIYSCRNMYVETCMWIFIASLFIRIQNWRQVKCLSTGEWIITLLHLYYGILPNNKKGRVGTGNNKDEHQIHYVKWKKKESEAYIQRNSIHLTFCKRQNIGTEWRLMIAEGWSERRGWVQIGKKETCEMIDNFLSLWLWLHNCIHWSKLMVLYNIECWMDRWKE